MGQVLWYDVPRESGRAWPKVSRCVTQRPRVNHEITLADHAPEPPPHSDVTRRDVPSCWNTVDHGYHHPLPHLFGLFVSTLDQCH